MGRVRIIGGKWRGRRLRFPPLAGLRPTPDRVKETLFNWLSTRVAGARCLDLFAGSGSLGFEAASRGAGEVVMVESNPQLARNLRLEASALDPDTIRVCEADALSWIGAERGTFDIVFLDPPFEQRLLAPACRRLDAGWLLAEGASVYIESRLDREGLGLPEGWTVLRARRAGQVRYYLASPGSEPARVKGH